MAAELGARNSLRLALLFFDARKGLLFELLELLLRKRRLPQNLRGQPQDSRQILTGRFD